MRRSLHFNQTVISPPVDTAPPMTRPTSQTFSASASKTIRRSFALSLLSLLSLSFLLTMRQAILGDATVVLWWLLFLSRLYAPLHQFPIELDGRDKQPTTASWLLSLPSLKTPYNLGFPPQFPNELGGFSPTSILTVCHQFLGFPPRLPLGLGGFLSMVSDLPVFLLSFPMS